MNDKIRPIYNDLQGYLSQLPLPDQHNVHLSEGSKELWGNLNNLVTDLNNVTAKDYNQFIINPHQGDFGPYVNLVTLRTTLGRLVARLHAEYFNDEIAPFSGSPSTVISQTQNQTQSVDIRFLLDIGSKIDEKLKTATDEKEKGFLGKLRSTLPTLKSGIEILKTTVDLAKEFGISPDKLSNIFS